MMSYFHKLEMTFMSSLDKAMEEKVGWKLGFGSPRKSESCDDIAEEVMN